MLTIYYSDDQIKDIQDAACGTYGREQSACRFRSKNLNGEDHLENESACGRIILKRIFGRRGMD